MLSRFWRNSLFGGTMFLLGATAAILALPAWRLLLVTTFQDEYGTLTYRCDYAMREHLIAKQRLVQSPSVENVAALRSMEIGLVACQDYDLMRKRLIQWGLAENDLSEMSLIAIEERASTLKDVVRIHEIRY